MATSDLLTTEDIDELDTAIQLKPHQKDIEFTAVTKSEEGDLVSLDELYEKTGQEAINIILEGYELLLKSNKLKREHGILLKVAGAESWLELPDKMNAIRGGEGFITNLANGFLAIVKRIIKFIKAIATWVYRRVSSLLGFQQSKEEKIFLLRRARETRKAMGELFKILKIDIDYDELVKSLPKKVLDINQINVMKNRTEKSLFIIENFTAIIDDIHAFYTLTYRRKGDIDDACYRYANVIRNIKTGIRGNTLLRKDIADLKYVIANIAKTTLNPIEYKNLYEKIIKDVMGTHLPGFGVDKKLNDLREQVKTGTEKTRMSFSVDIYEKTLEGIDKYYENTRNKMDVSLNTGNIKKLKDMVDESDAELIKTASEMTGEGDLLTTFIAFCNDLSNFSNCLDGLLEIVQDIEITLTSVINAHIRISMTISAILEKDIEKLMTANPDADTDTLYRVTGQEDPIFSFDSLDKEFLARYPNKKIPHIISKNMAEFWKSQFGKKFTKYLRGFLSDYQRKR